MQLKNRYNGIALFGPPGAGKSTVAKLLAAKIERGIHIEASREVLGRMQQMHERPTTKHKLFKTLEQIASGFFDSTKRKQGRNLYKKLIQSYGATIIAESLHYLSSTTWLGFVPIIAGARGKENAEWFKEQNYYVIYLDGGATCLNERLVCSRSVSKKQTIEDLKQEEQLYQTTKIKPLAHTLFNAQKLKPESIANKILQTISAKECSKCVNTTNNPTIKLNVSGLCQICSMYTKYFDVNKLKEELLFLKTLRDPNKPIDALVGFSGGKDSTATLLSIKQLGFKPLAFTFDSDYYPKHIFHRSKSIAKKLQVPHKTIDIRKYITKTDRRSYRLTANVFNKRITKKLKEYFIKQYRINKKHYSTKCHHSLSFIRACRLCRHTVIRAYYAEAIKHNVNVVILGMNEWTHLSQQKTFSAIRKIQPHPKAKPVYIVHYPFLVQRTLKETQAILQSIDWKKPKDEDLVESNSNSCLFALATERKATHFLGFHPDSTRLSREITAGFLTKKDAKTALSRFYTNTKSVREILIDAMIL